MQLSGASKASTATHTVEGSAIVIEDCSDDEEERESESPVPALWQYPSVQLVSSAPPTPALINATNRAARAWTPATPPLPAPLRKAALRG